MSLLNNWQDSWPLLLPEDIDYIAQQLASQPLSIVSGGVMKRFEKAFARFAGTEHAIATNNGTAALYSALWALEVRPGDEVLVCDYGFVAMAGAVATLGATLVPVDMAPDSFTIDVEDAKRKLTAKTKAVLVHNPWGVPAQLHRIRELGLPVVLDASHAHGATFDAQPIAALADIACFSLGMGKLITGGELGCAVTSDVVLRDRMLLLGHTNRTPHDLLAVAWPHNNVGLKFRPHVLALEIALRQLKRFEEKKAALLTTCQHIEALFARHGFTPQAVPEGAGRVYWRIVLRCEQAFGGGLPAATIQQALKEAGIPIEANHYLPSLQQQAPFQWPDYRHCVRPLACPVCTAIVPTLITLPAPVQLDATQLESIAQALAVASQHATSYHQLT